jgi:hypothetical protein
MRWPGGRRDRKRLDGLVLAYGSGSEFDPGDPFGLCVLTLTGDGRATLENRRRSQVRRWHGTVADQVLPRVLAALDTAGFPHVPRHHPRPGPTRTLVVESAAGTASAPPMDHYLALTWPGYGTAFSLLDRVVVALSDGVLAVTADASPDLVRIDWTRTEPAIRRPALPAPWAITYCTLRDVDPDRLAVDDARWGWLTEDQLWAEHPDGRTIDVGWYPDNSPTGRWRVTLIDDGTAGTRSEHRSVADVVAEVERLANGSRSSGPAPDAI